MQNLFDALATRYPSAARCASALGMSRQAYQQAQRRRHLSESKAMLAAVLLEIAPSDALLCNATGENPTPPVKDPAPDMPAELNITHPDNTNYARTDSFKKSSACAMAGQGARAGSASAMLGCLQFCVAAGAAYLVGVLHDGSAMPMAMVISLCGALAVGVALLTRRAQNARALAQAAL